MSHKNSKIIVVLLFFLAVDYDAIWEHKFQLTSQFFNVTEADRRLFQRLSSVQKSCGEVCDTSIKGVPGKVGHLTYHKNLYLLDLI
jgi:hypothetical protein